MVLVKHWCRSCKKYVFNCKHDNPFRQMKVRKVDIGRLRIAFMPDWWWRWSGNVYQLGRFAFYWTPKEDNNEQ